MTKKSLSLLMIALMVVMLISSCSQETYKSTLQTTTFTEKIDSSDIEILRFYDNKCKLQYTVTNDNQNLYVCVKATEDQTQFKIIRAGMQLSIGIVGVKMPPAVIQYPLAMGFQVNQNNQNQKLFGGFSQRPDIKALKQQFKAKYQELHLTGFKPSVGLIIPLKNEFGLNANLDWDTNNTLYYKAIIPFKTFYKDKLELSDSTKVMNICITINGIEMPHRDKGSESEGAQQDAGMNSNRMGGGSRVGGQGMNGGRMGGHQVGGGQAHDEMAEPNKIKFKLQLVVGKN